MIILCLVYAVCLLWTDDVDEQLSEAETPKSKKKKKAKKSRESRSSKRQKVLREVSRTPLQSIYNVVRMH